MLNNGWVKIHRKLMDKGYYKKSPYVHLWLHLLLKANHSEKEFVWNGKIIIIKQGQLLSGRKELSIETGITEGTIENILKMLESEQQIEQQKTTKFRVITILNWADYQTDNNRIDNGVTTESQQSDTNKNDKKEKNDKKDIDAFFEELYMQYFSEFVNLLPIESWRLWVNYRKEIKHKLTKSTAEAQLKKLFLLNGNGSKPIDVINQSIEHGWQGLFEIKGGIGGGVKQNTGKNHNRAIGDFDISSDNEYKYEDLSVKKSN